MPFSVWVLLRSTVRGIFVFILLGGFLSKSKKVNVQPLLKSTESGGFIEKHVSRVQGVPKVPCFLEALKYLKTSKQDPFEPPGLGIFHNFAKKKIYQFTSITN